MPFASLNSQNLQTLKQGLFSMLLIFCLTWWMVVFIIAQRNKAVAIQFAPGKLSWQQPKNYSHGSWKDFAQTFWKNSPLGQGASLEKCSPKGQHFEILIVYENRRLWNGNYGAITVIVGAVNIPVPSSFHEAIIFCPCNTMNYILLALKAEFSRYTITALPFTKFDLKSV